MILSISVGVDRPTLLVEQYFPDESDSTEPRMSLSFGVQVVPTPNWDVWIDPDGNEDEIVDDSPGGSPDYAQIDLPTGSYHLLFATTGSHVQAALWRVNIIAGACSFPGISAVI